ncbi:MAG TPA: hypothetical protein VGJ60_29390 [Chloroflexota bacterium]|jgi:hypothetical protein
MQRLPYERAALASGILFAIGQIAATAFFIAAVGPHLPPIDAPLADQQAFYTQFKDLNQLVSFLFIMPVVFLLPFLAAMQSVVKRFEGDVGVLTALVGIGGAALAMLWPVGIVIATAGQSQAASGLDPATVITFDSIAQLALGLCGIPRAALLVGVSLAVLNADRAPRALGISGLALAGLALVGVATLLSPALYFLAAIDTLLFAIWIAAFAIFELTRDLASATLGRPPVIVGAVARAQ